MIPPPAARTLFTTVFCSSNSPLPRNRQIPTPREHAGKKAVYPEVGSGISQLRFENARMPNPIHDVRYQVFREMLAEIRVRKGMLQSDVAEKLGKNQSFVSKYERGERRLDFPEFLDVADVLGIEVTEFVDAYRGKLARRKQ
jgi:ribosome-binding protein aMBF1 (putative translation factor)